MQGGLTNIAPRSERIGLSSVSSSLLRLKTVSTVRDKLSGRVTWTWRRLAALVARDYLNPSLISDVCGISYDECE